MGRLRRLHARDCWYISAACASGSGNRYPEKKKLDLDQDSVMPALSNPDQHRKPGDHGYTPNGGPVQGAVEYFGQPNPGETSSDGPNKNTRTWDVDNHKHMRSGDSSSTSSKHTHTPQGTKDSTADQTSSSTSESQSSESPTVTTIITSNSESPTIAPSSNAENTSPAGPTPSNGDSHTESPPPTTTPFTSNISPSVTPGPNGSGTETPESSVDNPSSDADTSDPAYTSGAYGGASIATSLPDYSGSTPTLTAGDTSNSIPTAPGPFDPTVTPTSSALPNAAGSSALSTSNASALPKYAIPLIVIGVLLGLILIALAVYGLQRRQRRRAEGQGLRTGGGEATAAGGGGAKQNFGMGQMNARLAPVVDKMTAVAAGVALGVLSVAGRLRGRASEEKKERERKYFEEVAAYARLKEEKEEHERNLASEKELEVEMASGRIGGGVAGRQSEERGREKERAHDAASQRSESMVVMSAALGYTPAPAPALISVTSTLKRSPSMVSSLSSSTRSQGQYERLVPSPVTDETPYVWAPPPVPLIDPTVAGIGNKGAESEERRLSAVPAVLRPGGG